MRGGIEAPEVLQKLGLKFWFYNDVYLSIEYIKTSPVFQQLSTQDKYALIFDITLKDAYMVSGFYSYLKRIDDMILYPDGHPAFAQKEQ